MHMHVVVGGLGSLVLCCMPPDQHDGFLPLLTSLNSLDIRLTTDKEKRADDINISGSLLT